MYQFKNGSYNGFVVAYKVAYSDTIALAELSYYRRAIDFIKEMRDLRGGRYKIFAVMNGCKEEIWDSQNSDF